MLINAHFDPDTLAVLRKVLDEAWNELTPEIQAKTTRSELATHILKEAASGVRDEDYLRVSAIRRVADRLLQATEQPH
jgi:hypothetical protein